jgi:aryl-alcohol dehydrogenase-like predicted oxidoreductase
MKYGNVPFFDKPISRIVLGGMPLPTGDYAEAFAILDGYRNSGGNAIDNAVVYGGTLASLLKAYYESRGEDALIRLDKGCHHSAQNDSGRRVSRQAIFEDIELNLERQGVSYSDFFVLHRDDRNVPVGDVIQWLNEAVASGKIRAFGVSNWHTDRLRDAVEYADEHRIQGISLSSPNLSLALVNEPMWWEAYALTPEDRVWYEQSQFPLFSWSSAGGGWFSDVDSPNVRRVYENEQNRQRRSRAKSLAAELGTSAYAVAMAWTLCQPANVFALVGPDTAERVHENMAVIDLHLSSEQLRSLEHGD